MGQALTRENKARAHENQHFYHENISLRFIWDPYLNSSSPDTSSFRINGAGLWFARYLGEQGTAQLHKNLRGLPEETILLPVIVPKFDHLDMERKSTLHPTEIAMMNEVLRNVSRPVVWTVPQMLAHGVNVSQSDGLHLQDALVDKILDVILNWKCNKYLDRPRYPQNLTCCRSYPRPTLVQMLVLTLCLLGISMFGRSINLALLYCFLADRTHIFAKSHKVYDFRVFIGLIGAIMLLGLSSLRRSSRNEFLNREQSDELKGWMQSFILVYHYLGASKVLPIYKVIRVQVAAYLFLTGYGHSLYHLQTGDFSLRRVTAVLLRLNLLSITLAYVMNTDYVFYYFAPLTSFWFLIVLAILRICQSWNTKPGLVVVKVVIAATILNLWVRYPTFPSPWLAEIFKTQWDAREWHFRLALDVNIVFVGILCALGKLHLEQTASLRPVWQIVIALGCIVVSFLVASRSLTKQEYNGQMPLFSIAPILAFLVLRNSTKSAREWHSSVFSWLGQCSLETFTLQFHIWMAADTKGLLQTDVLHLWLGHHGESILLTTVFLWTSWHVSRETTDVTRWFVGQPAANEMKLPSTSPLQKRKWYWAGLQDLRMRILLLALGLWTLNVLDHTTKHILRKV